MAEPPIDVDELVREVLAKLGAAPPSGAKAADKGHSSGSPAPSPSGPAAQPQVPATSGQPEGELVVPSRVVTMSELEGRLEGVRRLVVPTHAVLTPLVRDELNRKQITLVCDRPEPDAPAGSVRLVMMVLGSRFDPGPLSRGLESEQIKVETQRTDCLIAATDRLAGEVRRPNTLGLVVSDAPAVALCLANRHQGVRAVFGLAAARARAEAASVGANVLVVNPGTTGLFPMRRMVSQFCREGPRQCPKVLRKRLG